MNEIQIQIEKLATLLFASDDYEKFITYIENNKLQSARLMIEELLANNGQMIDLLNQCFADAEQENKQGIANFIAERLDAHGKHNWMLKSFLKDQRA